ncbi:MAG: RND family transporter [Granulosicoccus sp.]
MISSFTRFIINNAKIVLLVCMTLVGLGTLGVFKLSLTNEYRAFFSEDNPELLAFEKIQKTYSTSDSILIMMLPSSGNVFEKDTLQAVLDITAAGWQLPFAQRVDSLSNFQHTYGLEDELVIKDLFRSLDKADADIEAIRETALAEPLIVNRLISATGDATAINIVFNLQSEFDTFPVMDAIDAMVASMEAKYPDLTFYQSGVLKLNTALGDATLKDIITLVPIIYAVVVVGLAIFLRSFYVTVVAVLIVSFSISIAMGVAGWMGTVLTPPSASVPPIVMTLAVADCIHMLITFQQKRLEGLAQHDAIEAMMRLNITPVFLTTVTTILGFLSLNFSDAPPFRDLGNMTAIGVAAAFFLAITLLPALLSLKETAKPKSVPTLTNALGKLAGFVIDNRRWVLVVGVLVALGLSSQIPKNQLNDNFVEYFGTATEFRSDTDMIVDRLTGIYFIDYSIESGAPDGISNPKYLNDLLKLGEWLEEQPEVIHVNSIVEVIRKLHFNLHNDDSAYYGIPDDSAAVAQYLLLYEMSTPTGLDLTNQVNVDKSASRLTVTMETIPSQQQLEFENRVETWMAENTPALTAVTGSPSQMFSHISIRNIHSMLTGTAVALLAISFLLILPLRSVKHGLLSLVSNLVPASIAFGIWAMTVGNISLGVSVVVAMTLGIVVDDTIHFISKYLRARREMGLDPEESIRYAFQTVGVALFATTVILTAGFLVLTTSDFQINSHLSMVSAMTIVAALLVDLFLIPPLMLMIDRSDRKKPIAQSVQM